MSEHQWPALFECHPQPMWVVDPATRRIAAVNAAAVAHFGYTRDRFLELALHDLRTRDDLPTPLEAWLAEPGQAPPATPRTLGVTALRGGNGTTVQVEITVSAMRDGGRDMLLCMLQDAGERLRTEEALRLSQERFVAVTLAINGAIWDLDLVTGEVWRSDGTPAVYGAPPSEVGPQVDDWLERLHPEDAPRVQAGFRAAIESGRSSWRDEYRLRQPDGGYLDVTDYAHIVHDANGRPVRMVGSAVDVSEQRRAERERLRSERRLRSLFESSMLGIVFGDVDGLIAEANDAFLRIVGYTREELAERRMTAFDLTPPEYLPVSQHALDAVARRPVPAYEKEYQRKDGTRVPVLVSVATFAGSEREGFALVLDLTERRRTEAALAEHQRRLQALFDNTQDAILLMDDRGYYVDANPAACRLLGYTREEILRLHAYEMFPDDEQERVRGIRDRVRGEGRDEGEVRRRRKDGTIVEVEYHAAGNITPGIHLSVLRDITPRKEAERSLSDRQRRMQALFDNSLDAIVLFGDDGRYLDANPAACELYGTTREELLRMSVWDLLPPGAEAGTRELLRTLIATGRMGGEFRRMRRDGTILDVEARAVGNIVPGVHLSVLRDLGERKRAEEAMRSLSGRLLRLQDEERRRFARELHDSTGQSLAALSLGLAVVGDAGGKLPPRGRKALDEAQQLVQHCARELRTISYLLHPPLLDEMGLGSALRGYVDGFARRSGVEVTLEFPDSGTRLRPEVETALFRIVQECLSNIHRHSGSPTALIRLLLDAESIVLEVADQGHGLPAPAPGSGSLAATELGVGIAGMQERVRQLGGRLDFVSSRTGTTVRAVLPRVDS